MRRKRRRQKSLNPQRKRNRNAAWTHHAWMMIHVQLLMAFGSSQVTDAHVPRGKSILSPAAVHIANGHAERLSQVPCRPMPEQSWLSDCQEVAQQQAEELWEALEDRSLWVYS